MDIYKRELTWLISQEYMKTFAGHTILLSGATGMIGKCLVDAVMLFNQNNETPIRIIALSRNKKAAEGRFEKYMDNPNFIYIQCDVNNPIPECGFVDYVIHAASNTHPIQYANDSIGTISSNIFGTRNLLDYAITHGVKRFCFLSSVEIYGENRGDTEKFAENYLGYIDCNTLRSGYPESKRLGESLCNAYCQTHQLDFVIPRLSRCYGPTMLPSDSKAISQFIKKAANGEDIILKSEGNQKYSYSFVTDAVAAILFILAKGESRQAYNIADRASDTTLKELADMLAIVADSKVVFELPDDVEKKGYSTATKAMLNADKLESLGWEAHVHMQEGFECTVKTLRKK